MFSLSSLNPQQRLAVETLRGPVLILAGAGTGKTRVITCRIAHMIRKGISPSAILGVTFTNKAAREMRGRVRELVPRTASRGKEADPKKDGPTLATFHSLCVRILRQHIEKLGYKKNFVIYDEAEQLGVIKKALAQINSKALKFDAGEVLGQLSRLRNAGPGMPLLRDNDAFALARHIRPKYEASLKACNAVDFDDLILLVLRLFTEHPEALAACRAQYQYVMVDEYQDTNAAQFQLVHALTREHRNLCVVGDDDQSIYGWRGADITNLLDMEKHYPEVKVIKLEQNYRSTNVILKAANAVIRHNKERRGKNLWSDKPGGRRILLHAFRDEEEEARSIVERIEYRRLANRIPLKDQAILFRTNLQSRPIETALRTAAVRYHLIGGQSFYDRREVRDLLAYLKTFVNPHDDVSLLRIVNTPARGISEATMERLLAASQERKCSVFAVMKNPAVLATLPARPREGVENFVQFIDRTRQPLGAGTGTHLDLVHWSQRFLDEIGYFAELRRLEKKPEDAENRVRNIKELVASIETGKASGSGPAERLEDFLDNVMLDSDREKEDEPTGDAVTLITMHSCKGLEFPHVYVVGMEHGLLPHSRSLDEGTLDEERRLFYVAITRAKESLEISHCLARRKFGTLHPATPSHFLLDLPEELVEHADAKSAAPVKPAEGRSHFDALRSALD